MTIEPVSESLPRPVLTSPSVLATGADTVSETFGLASQKLREMILRSMTSSSSRRN